MRCYTLLMKQWNKVYREKIDKYKYYNVVLPHEDISKVERFFRKNKVSRVLDLGCGVGRNMIPLIEKGYSLSGIDIAEDGVRKLETILEEKKLKADLYIGNILKKLPFDNNYFDAIISVQVLQHGTEGQILNTISEIKRIIRPKGFIFITLCGRISNGHIRHCLVKTAKIIAPRTYQPTKGDETGLTHFIYNKALIKKHYRDFKILDLWKDKRDYYCFIAQKK